MKNRLLFILSTLAIMLLVVSQAAWVRQLIQRDKDRFAMELKQTLQNVVAFSLSKEVSGGLDQLNIELVPLDPAHIPENAVVKGSFDTKEYQSEKDLGNFLVGVFAEDLLEENKIPLEPIDSLFRKEFAPYSEIAAYRMRILKQDSVMREIYAGEKAQSALNDTTTGVNVKIPIGKTGIYAYTAHVIFKPTVFTRRLRSIAALSAITVIVISLLLWYQLVQIRKRSNELEAHKKAVRGIVHDLKSPLSYVYTLLGVFEKGEQNPDRKNMLLTSKTRVKYLSDKIEVLLSALKNKSHALHMQPEQYDFTRRCEEIMEELQVIYKDKNIQYSIEPAAGVTLKVDPAYFDGCVRNLLDNAVKYADNNPVLHITTTHEENKTILSFADNGKGIAEKDRKKIFTEFYRSDKNPSVKNHGVGLAFTRQIVRAHSGKILLKSEPGKGSVFTIVFPDKFGWIEIESGKNKQST